MSFKVKVDRMSAYCVFLDLKTPIMRHLILLFSSFLLTIPSILSAQSGVLQEFGQALRKGDAAGVAAHFDQQVVLDLLGKEAITTKADAQRMLQEFFKTHNPSGFKQSHSGSSQGKDSHYLIGDLSDAAGKYRVYLYFKTTGGKYLLQELRIDQ